MRIFRGISFLRGEARCTVLRSRCYQSGVRSPWVTRRRALCARWVSRKGDDLPATALVHARPSLARVLVSRGRARPRSPRSYPTSDWSLQMSAPRLKVHGLAYLLEEPLVQATRCLTHQPPTQTLTDVLV